MFAVGAYWIFERDRTIGLVQSLMPRKHRRVVRDTWVLIDQKLGAFVRGAAAAHRLRRGASCRSRFLAIGLPYWLLIGSFAGVVEIVPVIGPLAAGALAVGVGLTQSWHMALFAGLIRARRARSSRTTSSCRACSGTPSGSRRCSSSSR